MTSKSPVRSCEDIDEAALTYAEVKALATGNPYIKEKMELDIQVSKLKLLKANHTSQKYRLEDNITKFYPLQIAALKERISGLETDICTIKSNLSQTGMFYGGREQFCMQVGDKTYTNKKEAGTALIEMGREVKSTNASATIGEYAGFKIVISYESLNNKFVMNLKGELSHNLEIGADPLGNISRINHVLESMPKELDNAKVNLESVERQLETAKQELEKPFEKDEELDKKMRRLTELNSLLNMESESGKSKEDTQGNVIKKEKETTEHSSIQCKSVVDRLRQFKPDTEVLQDGDGRDTKKNRGNQLYNIGH